MSEIQFTTVDRVLAKIHRDLKGINLNESDAIEWIGEALDFLKVPQIQEEAVLFSEVKNHHVELPYGFHMILQVARNRHWSPNNKEVICSKNLTPDNNNSAEEPPAPQPVPLDCDGDPFQDYEVAYYRPFFNLNIGYGTWVNSNQYKGNYTPVRLANNVFFNSVVCKEKDYQNIYKDCADEYTIVGSINKMLRFSFKEGFVAISYLKNRLDPETGYPLIPDNPSYMAAIVYYLKWKIAEWHAWNGRSGFISMARENERLWLKYARQAKNYMKMPRSLDQYQNLLEQSHYLIPRHKRYYGYFGNLGRGE